MQCASINKKDEKCELQQSQENQEKAVVGGEEGPVQEEHGDDLNYKMVLVVTPCKTDMVISTTKL